MRSVASPSRCARAQRGMTLVELLVAVFMLAIIGAISVAVFMSSSETYGRTDDDVRGQQDIKAVTERLTKDLRAARGIEGGQSATATLPALPASNASQLVVWIDANSDYVQSPGETVLWQVTASLSSPGHFDVTRTVIGGTTVVVGTSVIDAFAFKYFTTAGTTPLAFTPTEVEKAGIVEVQLKYDAILGSYLGEKFNIYQVRLRNAE